MYYCPWQLVELRRMRSAMPAGWGSSAPGWLTFLGLSVGLGAWVLWMDASSETPPKLQAQPMAASPVPIPGSRLPTESQVTTLDGLSGQLSSRDFLQEVLTGSRLSPLWLKAHGFSTGSGALERLHGLMDGHVRLSAPSITKIAFGPQGNSSTVAASEMPALAAQERYVQALMSLPDGVQDDSVLVRWRNASDNTVMELSAQAIQPNLNGNIPLWMYSSNDWPPGRYRVEVISPDPGLQLLAAGDFEIAGSNVPLTPFSFEESKTLP